MTWLPPDMLARRDQLRAQLDDLTRQARDHSGCGDPGCPGGKVLRWLISNLHQLPALMALALVDRAAPGPSREDVEQVVKDTLGRCKVARLAAFIDGAELDEGADFWSAADASAVVDALATIGALRSQP